MSLLNEINKYYCNYCGWEDSNPYTHEHYYEECKTEEGEEWVNIDIIEQLFMLLDANKEVKIYRSENVFNEAYLSINIDSNYDNSITGRIKSDYSKGKRIDTIIELHNKYKGIEIYILRIANNLWLNTESANNHILTIIKKENNYVVQIPELDYKKYWATKYWRNY